MTRDALTWANTAGPVSTSATVEADLRAAAEALPRRSRFSPPWAGEVRATPVLAPGELLVIGGVAYMHPRTYAACCAEHRSLAPYRDGWAEAALRGEERARWADDGGAL